MIPEPNHAHPAKLVEVIDGDTLVADVELDFGAHVWVHVRIHGVNAPEHDTPEGPPATDYLRGLLSGRELRIQSYKDRRSFERWVADVEVLWRGRWDSVAQRLIDAGHGVAFMA